MTEQDDVAWTMTYCKFARPGLTSGPPETAESKCCNCFRIQGLQFDLVHAFVEQTISQNLPCAHRFGSLSGC